MIGRKASGEHQQQDGLGVEDGLGGSGGFVIGVWASAAWMAVEMLVNVSDNRCYGTVTAHSEYTIRKLGMSRCGVLGNSNWKFTRCVTTSIMY